jgi:tetratricopeptide (TPR) repeat protein
LVQKGDRIDRFVIDREAGVGGMGRVYRALDEPTGAVVAVKVLHVRARDAEERFDREIKLLQKLQHPGIVKYVAHGTSAHGHRWLAMEWLDGEPLGRRIAMGPLSTFDVITIGREIGEALGAAHALGIVHRDVKPQNLILLRQGGVKVLDFGIARRAAETISLTRTGMIVGSFHYMSPEQALGSHTVDARSDLFSLACVLYECLTGRRAFQAHDATAVLAKILLDAPIPIAEIRPNVPAALIEVIDRMLAKNADERPAHGHEVADALTSVTDAAEKVPASIRPPAVLGQSEQRIVCMVLAKDALDTDRTHVADDTSTSPLDTPDGPLRGPDRVLAALRDVSERHGGQLAILADGCALVTFGDGLALDQASRGAQCALAVHAILGDRPVALAIGQGVVSERAPIGSVIELAVAALDRAPGSGVRLVGVSEGMLGPSFEIRTDEHGLVLVGTRSTASARTLLGRETTCVGRDRELRTLEGLYAECKEEHGARAALVTASPGFGKSRVRYELTRRLAEGDAPPAVLIGRGDVVGAGSPFSMLRDAVATAAGVHEAMTPAAQVAALVHHLDVMLDDRSKDDRATAAAFLGELCGIPTPPTEATLAARGDTRAMGDGMRIAFEDWLRAHTRRGPVILVLEDLHWGDLPTVRFVDAALRDLAGEMLFVLALGRPEVTERFPNLWKDHSLLQLPLGPLARKAQEKLVREVLGEDTPQSDVERIVQRSEGNAFFLEELIRSVSQEHTTDTDILPKSVLAIVQARLDALDLETRRVLRAASIFGDRFTRSGVAGLVRDADVPAALDLLVRKEVLARGGGEDGYVFRHALVRESAYAMLTDEDRRLGHVLAAEWLEQQGEIDALVLAEHFERGGKPDRAARWLHRAAHQALGGDDLGQVIALAERALGSTIDRESRGRILWVQAEAHRWRGEMSAALEKSAQACDLLPPGSIDFYLALGEAIASCAFSGNFARAAPFFERALGTTASEGARAAQIVSIARGCTQMLEAGRYAEVDAIMTQFAGNDIDELEDVARGWVRWLLAMRALCAGDLGTFIESTEACLVCFQRLAESRNVCSQRTNLGYAYIELGDYPRGETLLRQVLHDAERLGLPMIVAYALHNLGNAVASQGRLDEALDLETRAVEVASKMHDPRIEGASRTYVAKMSLAKGDVDRAESETERALVLLKEHPALLALAHAVRGLVHLERRELDDALEETTAATSLLEAHGAFEDGETSVRLAHIRALMAKGDSGATDAARAAKERLLARAARIKDSRWRDTFLTNVADSRDTLAVAESIGA